MLISIKSGQSLQEVESAILRGFAESRFTIGEIDWKGPTVLNLKMIRLKEKKRYCGNHPNACDIEGGHMGIYLEGADWVEFNDRLNDVLDAMHVSAFVRSDRVVISRKGFLRRVAYGSHQALGANAWEWNYDEGYYSHRTPRDAARDGFNTAGDDRFENYCGRIAPASEYPEGTPGTYERVVASVGL